MLIVLVGYVLALTTFISLCSYFGVKSVVAILACLVIAYVGIKSVTNILKN